MLAGGRSELLVPGKRCGREGDGEKEREEESESGWMKENGERGFGCFLFMYFFGMQ